MDTMSIRSILGSLEQFGVSYVIIGGAAMNLHGLPRFTQDLDLFIEPTNDNIDRLKAALHNIYDDPHIDEITAADMLGDYPAIQYVPPVGTFYLDLLTRLGEAFRFEDIETERVEFQGLIVTVATPSTLFRMKKGPVRPRDWSDAAALKHHFKIEEE